MKNPLLHAHVKPWLILIATTTLKDVGPRSARGSEMVWLRCPAE
jgi:hypothetical protein